MVGWRDSPELADPLSACVNREVVRERRFTEERAVECFLEIALDNIRFAVCKPAETFLRCLTNFLSQAQGRKGSINPFLVLERQRGSGFKVHIRSGFIGSRDRFRCSKDDTRSAIRAS